MNDGINQQFNRIFVSTIIFISRNIIRYSKQNAIIIRIGIPLLATLSTWTEVNTTQHLQTRKALRTWGCYWFQFPIQVCFSADHVHLVSQCAHIAKNVFILQIFLWPWTLNMTQTVSWWTIMSNIKVKLSSHTTDPTSLPGHTKWSVIT